ncbi:MAG: DNA-binding protein [Rhodospirillales bacterium]|nr:DNA-binding protein [Rhodospirillales bacterium]
MVAFRKIKTGRTNIIVADRLREAAELLEQQGANRFRVRAYRRAAATVEQLGEDIGEMLRRDGVDALIALPAIGANIADHVAELIKTGHWAQLDRMRGAADPEAIFLHIPGVGPKLAHNIHEELHVDSLAALEIAAYDGSLAGVTGVGARRAAMIRAALGEMLGRAQRRADRHASMLGPTSSAMEEPSVEDLLSVDQEYREGAGADKLVKIAPRRFNPSGEAWLPILHTERGIWHFTALYSNTAQAHKYGRTLDWVVLFFSHDEQPEGSRTVVTESRGVLTGQRVVRGRESECRRVYGYPAK